MYLQGLSVYFVDKIRRIEKILTRNKRDTAMSILQRIRQRIIDRDYYISSHAEEEMFNGALERRDIEHAILRGRIHKKLTKDFRGTRYRIQGPARDGRVIHIVCRFKAIGNLVIITVYALSEDL